MTYSEPFASQNLPRMTQVREVGERREGSATATELPLPAVDANEDGYQPYKWHRTKKVPRHLLYVKKYVDLDQYIADFSKRKIIGYAKLLPTKRIELFGSTIVPIHVPLARWESAEQYEERFVQWLQRKGLTLRELETTKDDDLERFYRIKFANLNATGEEAFVPPSAPVKRGRSMSEERLPPSKKSTADGPQRTKGDSEDDTQSEDDMPVTKSSSCCVKRPAVGASVTVIADGFMACGCPRCLVEVTRFLARKVTELDKLVS